MRGARLKLSKMDVWLSGFPGQQGNWRRWVGRFAEHVSMFRVSIGHVIDNPCVFAYRNC